MVGSRNGSTLLIQQNEQIATSVVCLAPTSEALWILFKKQQILRLQFPADLKVTFPAANLSGGDLS